LHLKDIQVFHHGEFCVIKLAYFAICNIFNAASWKMLNFAFLSLENVQLEAARIITGLRKGTSHVKLYTELGWVPLKERRRTNKLILVYYVDFACLHQVNSNCQLH
jgi:hypothetical protein